MFHLVIHNRVVISFSTARLCTVCRIRLYVMNLYPKRCVLIKQQSPEDETSLGLVFYLPYTFAGSRQNELLNSIYFSIINIKPLVRLSQGNYRLHGTRPNILELFDYKLLYRGSGRCHSNTITIPLSLSHDCLYSFFTFNSCLLYTSPSPRD